MPHGWMLAPLDARCTYCGKGYKAQDTVWYREGAKWRKVYCEACGIRQDDWEQRREQALKEKAEVNAKGNTDERGTGDHDELGTVDV